MTAWEESVPEDILSNAPLPSGRDGETGPQRSSDWPRVMPEASARLRKLLGPSLLMWFLSSAYMEEVRERETRRRTC